MTCSLLLIYLAVKMYSTPRHTYGRLVTASAKCTAPFRVRVLFLSAMRTASSHLLSRMLSLMSQLIRDDLRASTGKGGEGSEWWRSGEEGREGERDEEQEEAHMDNLEDYVELLYEGKDKVLASTASADCVEFRRRECCVLR